MDRPLLDAMQARHSVRAYRDTPITGDTLAALQACIEDCNRQSGLHIQLVREEPRAFDGFMAHYGKFSGVKNYIADGRVQAKPGAGFYTKLDLGIVKCHFELGSGKDGSIWA